MNFYRIESWVAGYTKFPWVSGWGPLEHMPFFEIFPPAVQEMKKKSWIINAPSPGLNIDPGGRVWGDVLGCGGSPPSFFVGERIINDLRVAEIPILRATEMPIAKNGSKALRDIPPPKYYVLEAEPGMGLDHCAMGLKTDNEGRFILEKGTKLPPEIFSLDSWNGADLFGKKAFHDSTIDLLCTDLVKNLAERNGWTNIEFKPINVV